MAQQTNGRARSISPGQKKTTGQATIELALTVTFLALLLVGVADVARIYSEQLTVVHAAGVGARWATLPSNQQGCSGYGSVPTVVVADLVQDIPVGNIVSIQASQSTNPDAVRVNVTYRHDFLFGMIQNVPNQFTTGATMPGTLSTPSACYTTPTSTPTVVPTSTPNYAATQTAVAGATQTAAANATATAGAAATQTAAVTQTAVAATATSAAQATATAMADFTLSVSPTSQTVVHGNSTNFTITLTSLNGFASNVTLTATALLNATETFSLNPVPVPPTGSITSTLTVGAKNNMAPGNYTLTITGQAGTKTHSQTVTLIVQ